MISKSFSATWFVIFQSQEALSGYIITMWRHKKDARWRCIHFEKYSIDKFKWFSLYSELICALYSCGFFSFHWELAGSRSRKSTPKPSVIYSSWWLVQAEDLCRPIVPQTSSYQNTCYRTAVHKVFSGSRTTTLECWIHMLTWQVLYVGDLWRDFPGHWVISQPYVAAYINSPPPPFFSCV